MAAILDIEGAFNNVNANSILEYMDGYISAWIASMLKSRKITANLGGDNLPPLWLINMNKILQQLTKEESQAPLWTQSVT